ncbi:hypothetical protein M011DRAFT_455408 [Sporormia fimetaria CBS 119925]|uniref:Uncharacterized protein n=1 Tax=Sporormia fimetaria CBS 119925 TaxID=1340428 RepID=A0A6A6VP90_9PLEO|nr:hypothetical protein M011DRAFT_455408 [Sporormia fimetaria CBS 119925]
MAPCSRATFRILVSLLLATSIVAAPAQHRVADIHQLVPRAAFPQDPQETVDVVLISEPEPVLEPAPEPEAPATFWDELTAFLDAYFGEAFRKIASVFSSEETGEEESLFPTTTLSGTDEGVSPTPFPGVASGTGASPETAVTPLLTGTAASTTEDDGFMTILPFSYPGPLTTGVSDAATTTTEDDGSMTILPFPYPIPTNGTANEMATTTTKDDGSMTILPFPYPIPTNGTTNETATTTEEDGGFTIQPFPFPIDTSLVSDAATTTTEDDASVTIIPFPTNATAGSDILTTTLPASGTGSPEGIRVITFTLPSLSNMPTIQIVPFQPEPTTTARSTSTTYVTRTVTPVPDSESTLLTWPAFTNSSGAAAPFTPPVIIGTTPLPSPTLPTRIITPTRDPEVNFDNFNLRALCTSARRATAIALPLLNRFYGPNGYPSLHPFPGCAPPASTSSQALRAPGLLNCTVLGQDVQFCQESGKKILRTVRADAPEDVGGDLGYGVERAEGEAREGPWSELLGYGTEAEEEQSEEEGEDDSVINAIVSNQNPNLFSDSLPPTALANTLFSLFAEGTTEREDLRPLGPMEMPVSQEQVEDSMLKWWSKPLGEEVVVDGFDVQIPEGWRGTGQEELFGGFVEELRRLVGEVDAEGKGIGGVRGLERLCGAGFELGDGGNVRLYRTSCVTTARDSVLAILMPC